MIKRRKNIMDEMSKEMLEELTNGKGEDEDDG
jgi:hypothetical protein